MALVLGTNCGFVTTAPTADPNGSDAQLDGMSRAFKDTAPVSAVRVIEIGWWCNTAAADGNFEVGIYDHNAGDNNPEAVVGILSQTNAKGTDAGWKRVTGLNIPITAGEIYWIATQLDFISGVFTNYTLTAGKKFDRKDSQTNLLNPWGASDATSAGLLAFYAVWEAAATGTNCQINIGDAWKAVPAMQINIGDAWKAVAGAQINIGDAWKAVF